VLIVRAIRVSEPESTRPGADALSPRELEVVELLVEGLTNGEIAARLRITERTVHAHVVAARAKLGARSRTQLAVFVLRRGIVPLCPHGPDTDP
jgi:DNA-binding NarL/FixJ family response regulator